MRKKRVCKGRHYKDTEETAGVTVNSVAKNYSITLEFQARQKKPQSDYNFKEHTVFHGNKIKNMFNRNVNLTNNCDTSAEHVKLGHFVIKTCSNLGRKER